MIKARDFFVDLLVGALLLPVFILLLPFAVAHDIGNKIRERRFK